MGIANKKFDLAVVGAGIVGLSCALAAAKRGLSVVVVERDLHARGASVRNFGFITVTGQERNHVWARARRARDIWLNVATAANIPIAQRGLWLAARRTESAAVLEAFMRSDMAMGCELLTAAKAQERCSNLRTSNLQAVLWSPHELRIESRDATPRLANWLAEKYGVVFHWQTAVHAVATPTLQTSRGPLKADAAVVCPGDDLSTLFPECLAAAKIARCQLQMMRLQSPGFVLPGTVMSDLSLVRYEGFADLPEAKALQKRLQQEQREFLEYGIHLIVAQSSDGSVIVGDSHDYNSCPAPFANERVYSLLTDEYQAVIGHASPIVLERWMGTYAAANDRAFFIDSPAPRVRLAVVTSGIGASTGFALGEEIIDELFNTESTT
jgi:D-hydroxyproline dehydrogenase subunit beta